MIRKLFNRLSMAVVLVLTLAPMPSLGAEPLRLLVGYAEGSLTDFSARLLAPALEERLGREIVIEHLPGDHGFRAVVELMSAPADASTLLVADTLTLALNQVAGTRDVDVTALMPVSKISLGLSVAMIVRPDSPIADWDGFLTSMSAGQLSVSVSGRMTAYGVARSLVERTSGQALRLVEANGNNLILQDVLEGRADVGLVATNTVDLFNQETGEHLRPIVTFGAKRSPRFPRTPTFAEVTGDRHNDFTVAFSVFGPPDLPEAVIAELDRALAAALETPEVVLVAADHAYPAHYGDAEQVRLTLERDLRVAEAVAAYLDKP